MNKFKSRAILEANGRFVVAYFWYDGLNSGCYFLATEMYENHQDAEEAYKLQARTGKEIGKTTIMYIESPSSRG